MLSSVFLVATLLCRHALPYMINYCGYARGAHFPFNLSPPSLYFMPMFILDCGSLTNLLQLISTHKFQDKHVTLNGISKHFHKKDSVTTLIVSFVYFLVTWLLDGFGELLALQHSINWSVYLRFNPLTLNDLYISRTAPLTSKRCILNIYSTNVGT